MSNERTDEFLKWRGLLDQPRPLAEPVLDDKEGTWQKLADRLGERRSNRLSGYRIAAACLLFALIPAARLFQDHYNSTGASRHSPSIYTPAPVSATITRRPHVPALSTLPDRSRPAAPALVLPLQKTATKKVDRSRLPLLANIPASSSSITAAPLDSTSQSLFIKPSPSKELRVVHQNETHGGGTQSPSVGATATDRLIHMLFPPSRQQQSSAPPSPTEDPALLHIKLAPSN